MASKSRLGRWARLWMHVTGTWLRASKPTEWISSLTTAAGVSATIIAGYMLYSTGVIDSKKSELEAKKSEVAMQVMKLEGDQKELVVKRDAINAEINQLKWVLKEKEADLAQTAKNLGAAQTEVSEKRKLAAGFALKLAGAEQELDKANKRLEAFARHERAVAFLAGLGRTTNHRVGCDIDIDPTTQKVSVTVRTYSNERDNGGYGPAWQNPPLKLEESAPIVEAVSSIRNLVSLDIVGVALEPSDLQVISQIHGLTSLSLPNCLLSDAKIRSLKVNGVKRLNLSKNNLTVLPQISDAAKIDFLDVSHTAVDDGSLASFLDGAVSLGVFVADRTAVTDVSLRRIKTLRYAGLLGTKVTTQGVCDLLTATEPSQVRVLLDKTIERIYRNHLVKNKLSSEILMAVGTYGDLCGPDKEKFYRPDGEFIITIKAVEVAPLPRVKQ
ncbi:hypothetical protein GobsT_18670 [Gemmata obscuriglobus]|uniref:Uncharacterized protein n=1 Tax=Gemmata obscuriglobus TaxID=114 RepID=A0A2Z3H4I1_9BACT|nr:hypothetical protein [Gemmata obscuriglobus]AWM39771.1 hypothetical protein C1280_24050 [Gemmata obscuriglobus]QEG27114.1 hypothetical protein GobsT_18670 [Gemmata obscuriglobus]VTS03637.1 unnamed protein product [Gemmata obscuriglobus UQM 2246]